MLKIECDSPHDLLNLLQATVDARVSTNVLQNKVYTLQDEKSVLVRKVEDLNYRLSTVTPKPDYAPLLKSLIAEVTAGQKINAIKLVREMTGLGLKEAKDLVEEGARTPAR